MIDWIALTSLVLILSTQLFVVLFGWWISLRTLSVVWTIGFVSMVILMVLIAVTCFPTRWPMSVVSMVTLLVLSAVTYWMTRDGG